MKDKWLEYKNKKRHWKVKRIRYSNKKPRILKGRIRATQYAIKTGANNYKLIMKGMKRRAMR